MLRRWGSGPWKIWLVNNVNWPPKRIKKADVSSVSPSSEPGIHEGLTIETYLILYGGQVTLSTQLIKLNFRTFMVNFVFHWHLCLKFKQWNLPRGFSWFESSGFGSHIQTENEDTL